MSSTDTPDDAPRLYLVTPEDTPPEALEAPLAASLATGLVACVRLMRERGTEEETWRRAVNRLLPVCHAADVPLLVTDAAGLVAPLGLDGVHLTTPEVSIATLRKSLGPDRIIGAAAGHTRHKAMTLAEAGADYVSLGPFGPGAGHATLDTVEWWSEMIETPLVAEGGIDLEAARKLAPFADFLAPDPTHLWPEPATALQAFADAIA